MSQDDFYAILHVAPDASNMEIKKAYRKLAIQFHPDKHPNSSISTEQFRLVTEAYKTLSNPSKRIVYHQKKYPGYFYNKNDKNTQEILTELRQLNLFIKAEGQNCIDYNMIERKVTQLLNNQNLHQVKSEKDGDLRKRIIQELLECCNYLEFPMIVIIINPLKNIAASGDAVLIDNYLNLKKKWYIWDQYKIVAALIIAATICLFIYRIGY